MFSRSRSAFTLIELLVVIAIIAILAVIVVLVLNPAELLKQSRDANRLQDMQTLSSALNLYTTDQNGSPSFSLGSSSVVYVSIPDPAATSSLGDQCQGLGLLTLPGGYAYHCAASSTLNDTDGTGWIPVDLKGITTGPPLGSLPVDPVNTSSSRLYYTYTTNGFQYELTMVPESQKYQIGGTNDVISGDGASLATVYAKGSNLTLEPLDYGDPSLLGYWPLNEGSGNIVYDDSGNGNEGAWNGIPAGTNGYYSPGPNGGWAGMFDGTTTNISTNVYFGGPPIYSLALWFKTTTTQGGKLIGFGNSQTGLSSNYDRHIYMTNTGQLVFGNYPGGIEINISSSSYNDGQWHFVVGTLSAAGQDLYIDGGLVASSTNTGDQLYSGYWRIGYDNLNGWPNTPSSDYFNGLIRGIRFYNSGISAARVAALYDGGK